ncbi:hypothetical protein [Xylocopilactobacillus apicola]|uniref:Tetratricopeptide repeat protein n=1 Tax=Xylocopilactobacillus apicola TaxID=2932184 RepID=A0AAU9DAX8_9LACO|nr:hypothetical protein [Xylocopilactobacillus apicola]BDR59570.1 hypothetical protein XA3_20110 [Xylocopilactobacillus apicola]
MRSVGYDDEAAYHQREIQNRKNLQLIMHARVLENEGELKKAAKILLSIDPNTFKLYQRIAINLRKQKDYLTDYEPNGNERQKIEERLTTAEKLLAKEMEAVT